MFGNVCFRHTICKNTIAHLIVELKPDVINIEISLGLVKVHKFLNIFK